MAVYDSTQSHDQNFKTIMDVPVLAKYEDVAFTFLLEHHHDPHTFSIHQIP